MLACEPLLKMIDLSVLKYRLFLVETLQVYDKNLLNVVCLVEDSCTFNMELSKVLNIPIVGCHSHKWNLAI